MIEAKLKGEGIDVSEPAEPDRTNVVDLMSALKKSWRRRWHRKRRHSHLHLPSRSVPLLLRQPSQARKRA